MKLLSIIIPMYNSAPWLEKCLNSVLNQNLPLEQLEIICINDGSPDNSADLARKMGKKYECIVVLNQENQGPSGARNNGMRHATGKYLMFVDPDDYVESNTFGGLVQQMEDEQLDILRFNFQMVNEHYEIIEKPLAEKLFDYTPETMSGAEFIGKRLDGACNIWRYIYRKDIIVDNNIWCYTGDYFDDTPWLPLVLLKANKMNISNTVVYDYLERSDSLVKSVSERSIQRKLNGYLFLLRTLKQQEEHIECDNTLRVGVRSWYNLMMGYSVVSLLALVAQYRYEKRYDYLKEIQGMNMLPLRYERMIPKMVRKAKWINCSPILFMSFYHYKNRR